MKMQTMMIPSMPPSAFPEKSLWINLHLTPDPLRSELAAFPLKPAVATLIGGHALSHAARRQSATNANRLSHAIAKLVGDQQSQLAAHAVIGGLRRN